MRSFIGVEMGHVWAVSLLALASSVFFFFFIIYQIQYSGLGPIYSFIGLKFLDKVQPAIAMNEPTLKLFKPRLVNGGSMGLKLSVNPCLWLAELEVHRKPWPIFIPISLQFFTLFLVQSEMSFTCNQYSSNRDRKIPSNRQTKR